MQKVQQLPSAPAALQDLPVGINGPDMSDLPSQIDYALAFPKQGEKRVPFALTFREQTITVRTLLDRFLKATSYSVPLAKDYFFILNNGIRLQPKWEIKDLLKLIGKERLDGVVFNVHSSKQKLGDQQYVNECCVIDYKNSKNFYLRVQFTMPGNSPQVVYVKFQPSSYGSRVIEDARTQIKSEFGLKELQQTEEDAYFYNAKKERVPFKNHQLLTNQKIYNGDTIQIKIKNTKNLVLKRVMPKFNSWIVIYKEGETQPIKLKYDDIYHLTFGELYKTQLQLKQSQKKKQAIYCLKIMDKIVKPLQKMSTVEDYFINNEAKPLQVVGKVVNEKMIFYKIIPSLTAKTEFTLNEIQIPKDQHSHRELCRTLSRQRAQKSTLEYFKKEEHVQPILIYTSQLRYFDKKTKKAQKIYVSLNKYLRQADVLSLDSQTFNEEWRLRYASTLLKHLQKAQIYQGTAWRGISFNPNITKEDEGKIFTFKQFTSSSKMQSTAKGFAKTDENGKNNLFRFQVKTGKSVIEYSSFEEGEILIEPHTEFLLTKIQEKGPLRIYHMVEQQTSKVLPGIKANFVVWIDDKTGQNKQIFESMKLPSETTIFEQITSTTDLIKWLDKHKVLFFQETANLIFITNMTRKQGNNLNYEAGIEGLREIRKVSAQLPVFFFIGNLQATNKKLTNSKLPLKNVKVGNQTSEISMYLNQQLNKKK